MKITEVADRNSMLIEQLLKVWESSVRATHLFLSENEIENIKKGLPQAIPTNERFFGTYALSEGKASATAG